MVKDAGDDPDCTDGAQLTADVRWVDEGATVTTLDAGPGVGTITKPGLGLQVGAPAINPVPRRMILAALAEITDRPMVASISVPGGEAMTSGPATSGWDRGRHQHPGHDRHRQAVLHRFLSGLGRPAGGRGRGPGEDGPWSCAPGAGRNGGMTPYATLDPVSFVEVGDFSGIALRRCAAEGMTRVKWWPWWARSPSWPRA